MSILNLTSEKIDEMIMLIEQKYPDWKGFSDPRFEKDEVIYKQDAVAVAEEFLTKARLENFLENDDFDGFQGTLMKVAQAGKNLLFLAVPKQGDMGILMVENIDKHRFMEEFINLLYGEADSPARLERFSAYTKEANLPDKWTFPTYFLFVSDPINEIYVKPHTTMAYLGYFGKKEFWTIRPSGETYRVILDIAAEMKRGLSSFHPRDMVDIQGFLWVMVHILKHTKENPKKEEFLILFSEFKKDYFSQKVGQEHLASYSRCREEAVVEYPKILEMKEQGMDVTNQVLTKLLPYHDTAGNRKRDVWIHVAPSIIKDIKEWYEGAKWTKPEDWPRISEAILEFISKCMGDPDDLVTICKEFSELPYSKGFQSGMLTPILNALNPDEFILFNNKSCKLFNYFLDSDFTTSLTYYPEFNEKAKLFIEEVREFLPLDGYPEPLPGDFLDMFSHWLVAEINFFKPKKLADPFSKMFKNIEQANYAFDLLELVRNKISNLITNEKLFSVTLRQFQNGYMIRINFGNWLVFGINGLPKGIYSFHIAQPTEKLSGFIKNHGKFIQDKDEIQVTLGEILFSDFESNRANLLKYFDEVVEVAVNRFSQWKSSSFRYAHNDILENAILDSDLRLEIFENGLSPKIPRFWKIAPGEKAWNWDKWKNDGIATIGWEETGDLSGKSEEQFNAICDELLTHHPEWSKQGIGQVWDFVKLEPGDKIVANKGTTEVIGIGTVTGSYKYVPDERHGHHIPVRWEEIGVRKIEKRHWVKTMIELAQEEFDEILAIPIESQESLFDEETFSLLAELDLNPSASVYNENKERIKAKIIEPLQNLMKKSKESLNEEIIESMETEKGLFSRILKNDFGQGGAWPFYWGAFYPIGLHKNSTIRLATAIYKNRFSFGISFGYDSSKAKSLFDKNCQENLSTVAIVIQRIFTEQDYLLEIPDVTTFDDDGAADNNSKSFTWEEWLKSPEMSKYSVTKVLPKRQVVQMSFAALVSQVSYIFNQLYPLVLLAIDDDPIPKIFDYLEMTLPKPKQPDYSLSELVESTGFNNAELTRWVKAIERKKQAIIYGPPGTGKTFVAEKLARHLIGGGDGFFELIQFHPEVSYEDFIQGIRPEQHPEGGLHYPVVPGRFLKFCEKASSRNDTCVLIIDEINRANLARVFGELMYLLEYRDKSINLSAGTSFSIPKNVRIIGTMNTADRSIALVDHALRRRFAFLALYPDFDILKKYHQREQTLTDVSGLISVLKNLNDEIQDKHYMIGTSYFLRRDLEDQIEDIWRMEIEPYLEEFFFDQPDKYKKFTWEIVSARIL